MSQALRLDATRRAPPCGGFAFVEDPHKLSSAGADRTPTLGNYDSQACESNEHWLQDSDAFEIKPDIQRRSRMGDRADRDAVHTG